MTEHYPPPRDALDAPKSLQEGVGAPTFAAVFMRYQREIQAFLRGMLGAHELAQDLTQDTFSDAWRAGAT